MSSCSCSIQKTEKNKTLLFNLLLLGHRIPTTTSRQIIILRFQSRFCDFSTQSSHLRIICAKNSPKLTSRKGSRIQSQDEQNQEEVSRRFSSFFHSTVANPFQSTFYSSPESSDSEERHFKKVRSASFSSLHHDDLHLRNKITLHRFDYVNSEADLLELRQLEAGERYNRSHHGPFGCTPRPSSEVSRTSLLGRPLKPGIHRRDARYRKLQNKVYNFLERPRGCQAVTYHVAM